MQWLSSIFSKRRKSSRARSAYYRSPFAQVQFEVLETRQLLAAAAVGSEDPPVAPLATTESIQDSWSPLTTTTLSTTQNTGEKPQSKVWTHDGEWFAVLPDSSGTWIWRLDAGDWSPVLKISDATGTHADVKATGNVTHILLFDGGATQLASVEYVAASHSYQPWSARGGNVDIALPGSSETATIDIDSQGRMWLAYEKKSDNTVEVRYSDGVYSNWSAPLVVASGIANDDISGVVALPTGQIGVFWSDQNSHRFGFRTHSDGANANSWNAPEVPAAQSAASVGHGMADDHFNMAAASDGTLYVAVKTGYDNSNYPEIALLVRRPGGSWDPLYEVDNLGTRPIVALNEQLGRLLVMYTIRDGGGNIMYRETSTAAISFGPEEVLIGGTHNNVTSTKQNFTDSLFVVASTGSKADGTLLTAPVTAPLPENAPPSVSAGPDRSTQVGSAVTLSGSATDDGLPSGSLSTTWSVVSGPGSVNFANSNAATTSATFNTAGTYTLRLTASDGDLSASDTMTVSVSAPAPTNQAPSVNAGPDRSTEVGSAVTLSGSATDDGLPSGTLSTTWSVVSGPGSVNFANSNAASTTATFNTAGTYTLRLTASDGALSASDTMTVSVASAPTPSPTPGVAGFWKFDSSGNPVSDASGNGNSGTLQNGASIGIGHDGSGLVIGGSGQYFNVPDSATLDVSQSITIAAWIKPQSQGTQYIVKKAGHNSTDGFELSLSNKGKVFVRFNENSSGNSFRLDSTSSYPTGGNTWMHVVATYDGTTIRLYVNGQLQGSKAAKFTIGTNNLPLTIGAGEGGYRAMQGAIDDVLVADHALSASEITALYQGTFNPSPSPTPNQAPSVNAGPDRSTEVGSAVTLSGSATDDGLPSGTLSTTWSVVSGPGSVNFANSNAASTTATFNTAGTYTLRLTASDGDLSASDTMTVSVSQPAPTNQAPSVNAGPDRSTEVGSAVTLSGSATDDGLPSGSLSTTWSVVSGPGSVNFANSNAASTTATFNTAGTYTLRLTASDGDLSASDTMTVSVSAPAPTNQAPSVNAGPDRSTQVGSAVTLSGSATDDGLPSGTLSTTWSVVSGPGSVNFANSNAASTTATFNTAGTYTLRLTASDGAMSASDTMTVSVSAPAPTNQAPTVSAGPDRSTEVGSAVTLSGSATDDGLPSGSLSTTWSVVSGPGSVNFANSNAATTSATFNTAGTYTLRLTASDGALSTSDTMTVSVASAPTPSPTPGVAGFWKFDSSGNPVSDDSGNGNSGTLQNGASIGTGHDGSGLVIGGSGQYFNVPDSATLDMSQSITIAAWIKPQSQGTQYVVKKAGHSSTDGFELSLSNKGKVFVRFNENSSGNSFRLDSTSSYPTGGNTWMHVVATYDGTTIRLYVNGQLQGSKAAKFTIGTNNLPLTIGAGEGGYRAMQGAIDDVLVADRALSASEVADLYQGTFNPSPSPTPNQAPSVNAGPDRSTEVGTAVTLSGSATDDGLPSGSLSTTWSVVSGPGSVNFANSNAATTSATFNTAGTYTLRLTASDGALSASDTMTVSVSAPAPTNQAPSVNAGPDRSTEVGSAVTLSGSATDDGLPSGTLSTTWSVVSGPGSVNFANSNAATTSATFNTAGTYTLRLTASDGVLSASDTMTVSVSQPAPTNQAPSVSAGPDRSTQVGSAVTLSGSATDDGLPSGTLSTTWSVVSGPGSVNFANSNAASTTATFNTAGTYTLRLTASDGALSTSDTMTVSVASAPTPSPTSGVVALWDFDGSANPVSDASGNGNSGTLQNGASIGTGHDGGGLVIGGSGQYVNVPDSATLDVSQSITIAAWIKPQSQGTQYIVKKAGHNSTDGFELSLSNKGKVFVRFNQDSAGNSYRVDSTSSYPTGGNTWMHVVATYDGTTIRLYINGQLQGSRAANFTIGTNDLPLTIGAGEGGYRPMLGTIDDVLVADRALSASEITALYEGTLL